MAKGLSKAGLFAVIGFAVGAAAGFAYGQQTRKNFPSAVDTQFSGGVLTVKVDAWKAAAGGLAGLR